MRYWFIKHWPVEVNVADRKYRRRHWVGRSREVLEAQYSDCGMGVVTVGLGIGEKSKSEFIVLGSRYGKEGSDWRSSGWVFVRRTYNGKVGGP